MGEGINQSASKLASGQVGVASPCDEDAGKRLSNFGLEEGLENGFFLYDEHGGGIGIK